MFELSVMVILMLLITVTQCVVLMIQNKWSKLSNETKLYLLTNSYVRFLIEKETLTLDNETFGKVMEKKDSYKSRIMFLILFFSIIGTVYILCEIMSDYMNIKRNDIVKVDGYV